MKDKTYKELESELSLILDKIDQAEHEDLDDLLKDFEHGQNIIKELEQRLKTAKIKIATINGSSK